MRQGGGRLQGACSAAAGARARAAVFTEEGWGGRGGRGASAFRRWTPKQILSWRNGIMKAKGKYDDEGKGPRVLRFWGTSSHARQVTD